MIRSQTRRSTRHAHQATKNPNITPATAASRLPDQLRLNDGYSKMIVDDIIIALNEALKSISVAGNKLLEASATADSHNPDDTATS